MKNTMLKITMLMFIAFSANAAQLDLAKEPLELSKSVEPNIMLLIDDSGSMDLEVLTDDFANNGTFTGNQPDGSNLTSAGDIVNRDSNNDGNINCLPFFGDYNGYIYGIEFGTNLYGDDGRDCNTADDEAWRFRNSDFNKLYYDPERTYEPWVGTDASGSPFTDADINKAPDNPYAPSEYIDLTKHSSDWTNGTGSWEAERTTSDRNGDGQPDGFRYYTWEDKDNDGNFDNGEETEHFIKDKTATEQQNFANWFAYHRSRAFAVNSVLSSVLEDITNVRIGFATINEDTNRKRVASMNASPTTGSKKTLYDSVFGSVPKNAGTPLRKSLAETGQYFACLGTDVFGRSSSSSPGDAACPVLPSPQGQCQQNYTLLLTDGFYNGSSYAFGNQDSVGPFAGGAFADSVNNTLADIAMYYYRNDIHPSLDNEVTATTIDARRSTLEKGDFMHQHMKTFTLSFGLEGDVDAFPADYTSPFSWPSPYSGTSNEQFKARIDDLRHAAYNGRGDYLSVKSPDLLKNAVEDLIGQIREESGTASAVAFNTQSISSKSLVYRAFYNTKNDTGDLVAQKINGDGTVSESTVWSAAEMLDSKVGRNIFTYTGSDGAVFEESPLNATQKTQLNTPFPSNLPVGYGNGDSDVIDERIAYLRGDRSNEGLDPSKGEFRERLASKGLLGDIINSTPVYVGAAPFSNRDIEPFPTGATNLYSDYRTDTNDRREMIYVGANDGMLHGFDANTGEEIFGYVPGPVYKNLSEFTSPTYTHEYYVDGTPAVNDLFINGSWKTVLIGGLRSGGKGFFALDISDPDEVDEDAVLWEFTESDDGSVGNSDLGYSYSTPVMAMTNSSDGSNQSWAMIVGNGYNSTSADGESALYVIDMNDKSYVKIKTGFGKGSTKDGVPNGLGKPRAVDADGNGTVDYVYAGDLAGNMYRFDLTSSNKNNWDTATLVYTAENDAGDIQPITAQPSVVSNDFGKFIVVFGTGSWMTNSDATSTSVQSLYGIQDEVGPIEVGGGKGGGKGGKGGGKATPSTALVTKADLIEQEYTEDVAEVKEEMLTVRKLSDNRVDYEGGDKGWFIDLDLKAGERAVRQLQIRGNIGFVNTLVPNSQSACSVAEGGFELAFDPIYGGVPDKIVFDVNEDGKFNSGDLLDGSQIVGFKRGSPLTDSAFLGDLKYTQLSDKSLVSVKTNTISGGQTGRFSWTRIK